MGTEAPDTARGIRPTILVVDDDPGLRDSFRVILQDAYEVLDVPDGSQGLEILRTCQVDLVLLDVRLPGMDGLQVLEQIKALDAELPVILVTAVRTVRTAVSAMKLGAFDYVTKPFDDEEVQAVIRRALERRALEREVVYLRSELARRHHFDEIVGQSAGMRRLFQTVAQVARTTATVLISGESGTGKEMVARAIHRQSPRRDRPFVAVNPSAVPETLLESELFGHERGAFTGAHQRRLGRFELAQGGTLFLDEIASLKPDLQVKLLRVLQEREIERVGGGRSVRVDVRIIAATNTDLRRAVSRGSFREDLYYRLAVVPLTVPSLRDRPEDIPLLAEHFVRKYGERFGKRVSGLSPEALAALRTYPWPGNVRELENVVERATALVDGPLIEPGDLPLELSLTDSFPEEEEAVGKARLREALEQFERRLVQRVLERVDWNQTEAARLLGMHRNNLRARIARWNLRPADEVH